MSKIEIAIRYGVVRVADLAGWLTIVDPRLIASFYQNAGDESHHFAENELPYTRMTAAAKRGMDICVSAVTLFFVLPVLTVVPLLVKLTSKGPVLLRQRRVGYKGRKFTLYKFRTISAEEPRLTRVGIFLRQTRIDELPQLLNVLKGDMSLVGPRPLTMEVLNRGMFAVNKEFLRMRLSVPPGITGLRQVSTLRSTVQSKINEKELLYWTHHVSHSLTQKQTSEIGIILQYLAEWSVWLDLLIFARATRNWFWSLGAYFNWKPS